MEKSQEFIVFISWSTEPSKQIAEEVKKLFNSVFAMNRNIKFFLSSSVKGGIDKGEKFQRKLEDNLVKSNFGLIILTKNNKTRSWIMFESGALSKNVDIARVSPILFDIEDIEKESPLFGFQNTKFSKEDFNLLSQSILKAFNDSDVLTAEEETTLFTQLDSKWGVFEENVNRLLNDTIYKMNDLNHSLYNEGLSSENLLYLERDKQLEELIDYLHNNKLSRIIIFGGISTIIRDATKELAKWIIDNENSQLFICYENDDLISERNDDLTDNVYGNLNKDTELLNRKKNKLNTFMEYFNQELGIKPNKRIHFIELSERLSGYVTINGNELFFTPLLHKRSSLTFTFKLKDKQMLDVVDYMISKLPDDCRLISELEMVKSEFISK